MTTKNLYIVDHFVPFPASEYGGVWNVIAETDEECFDLITEFDDDQYVQHYGQLRENIVKSDKYTITDDVESKVVSSFLTWIMTNHSVEQLLINLQSTIKELEEAIDVKNKEIENLKNLLYKIQDIKENKWWLNFLLIFHINHLKIILMKLRSSKQMLFLFGWEITISMIIIMVQV